MAEIALAQADADALIAPEKRRVDEQNWQYPGTGGYLIVPLVSTDERRSFFLTLGAPDST